MSLLLTNAFEDIKRRYLEVIEQTPGMAEYTRWKYGQHPSDEMLQGYINRGEGGVAKKKGYVEILEFTHFLELLSFNKIGENNKEKELVRKVTVVVE